MTNVCDINELPKIIDWINKSLVILGRGNGVDSFKYNPTTCVIMAINDSCLLHSGHIDGTIIVEAHFTKNFPIVNEKVSKIFYMSKQRMKEYQLTVGCTPSLVLSFIIKNITNWKRNIYLQGFSMDGVSPPTDPFPYNWERQIQAFTNLFELANKFETKMRFVTPNTRMLKYPHGAPDNQDIVK